VALKPVRKAGPTETAVRQDARTDAVRKCLNHSQKRVLLEELILASFGRQAIAVIGQLEQEQGTSLARYGDAQDLVANALSKRSGGVEYRPIDGQSHMANPNKRGCPREAMVWEMKASCTSLASIRLLSVKRQSLFRRCR
jgi:hypothetical protein